MKGKTFLLCALLEKAVEARSKSKIIHFCFQSFLMPVCVCVCVCVFSGCCLFLAKLHGMWGILDPRPGIDPMAAALEARSLNHWATREVPDAWF